MVETRHGLVSNTHFFLGSIFFAGTDFLASHKRFEAVLRETGSKRKNL
jgi:hypothetical protein